MEHLCAFAIFLIVSTVTVQANVDVNIEVVPPAAQGQQGVTIIIEEQAPTVTINVKDACDAAMSLYNTHSPALRALITEGAHWWQLITDVADPLDLGYLDFLLESLRRECQ